MLRARKAAAHAEAHKIKAHVKAHEKLEHRLALHSRRIVPAVQPTNTSASVVIGSAAPTSAPSSTSAASPAIVVVATGTAAPSAQAPAVATSMTTASAPAAATTTTDTHTLTAVAPTTTDPGDVENGPLAKAGQDLITIYEEFQQQGGSATFTSSEAGRIRIVERRWASTFIRREETSATWFRR